MLKIDIKAQGNIKLEQKKIELASLRATNKTADWLKTHAAREIAQEAKIPVTKVKKRINIYRANRKFSFAKFMANIYSFEAAQIAKPVKTSKGVKVKGHEFDGAFIGKNIVFRRKTKARLPLNKMRIFIDKISDEVIDNLIDTKLEMRFNIIFERELSYLR